MDQEPSNAIFAMILVCSDIYTRLNRAQSEWIFSTRRCSVSCILRKSSSSTFLVPRFTPELFQDGNPAVDNEYTQWQDILLMHLLDNWLDSLNYHWFSGHCLFRDILCEYKLIQVLKQISRRPHVITGEKWHSSRHDIVDIYMRAVETAIESYRWSTEITIAVFQRWSKMVVDTGIDLSPYVTSQDANVQSKFRGHISFCCKSIQY